MADKLYLSLWVDGFNERNMLRHFEQLLGAFPFSRLRPGIAALRIYAIAETEPPLLEQLYGPGADVSSVIESARQFENADCEYLVEGFWELWQYEQDWKLQPARVTLLCFGPQFENDLGDHLRIELGLDEQFLPQPALPQGARMAQSNLQSVLRLAAEIEKSMPVAKRSLWTESGENFAEVASKAFSGEPPD